MFKIYKKATQLAVISALLANVAIAENQQNGPTFDANKFVSILGQVATESAQSKAFSISPRSSRRKPKKVDFSGTWKGMSYLSVNSCSLDLGGYESGLVTNHRVIHKGTGILLTAQPSGETFGGSTSGKTAFSVLRSEDANGCTISTKAAYSKVSGNNAQMQFSLLYECGSDQCLVQFNGKAKK